MADSTLNSETLCSIRGDLNYVNLPCTTGLQTSGGWKSGEIEIVKIVDGDDDVEFHCKVTVDSNDGSQFHHLSKTLLTSCVFEGVIVRANPSRCTIKLKGPESGHVIINKAQPREVLFLKEITDAIKRTFKDTKSGSTRSNTTREENSAPPQESATAKTMKKTGKRKSGNPNSSLAEGQKQAKEQCVSKRKPLTDVRNISHAQPSENKESSKSTPSTSVTDATSIGSKAQSSENKDSREPSPSTSVNEGKRSPDEQEKLKFMGEVVEELWQLSYESFRSADSFRDIYEIPERYRMLIAKWPLHGGPDLVKHKYYHEVIKKPMDFGSIRSNLLRDHYETAEECKADVNQVFMNCYEYGHMTMIADMKSAKLEVKYIELMTASPGGVDLDKLKTDISEPQRLSRSYLESCRRKYLFTCVWDHLILGTKKWAPAIDMTEPVCRKKHQRYYDMVKKPMDLGTIARNLITQKYKNAAECVYDIKLMFSNWYNLYDHEPSAKKARDLEAQFDAFTVDLPFPGGMADIEAELQAIAAAHEAETDQPVENIPSAAGQGNPPTTAQGRATTGGNPPATAQGRAMSAAGGNPPSASQGKAPATIQGNPLPTAQGRATAAAVQGNPLSTAMGKAPATAVAQGSPPSAAQGQAPATERGHPTPASQGEAVPMKPSNKPATSCTAGTKSSGHHIAGQASSSQGVPAAIFKIQAGTKRKLSTSLNRAVSSSQPSKLPRKDDASANKVTSSSQPTKQQRNDTANTMVGPSSNKATSSSSHQPSKQPERTDESAEDRPDSPLPEIDFGQATGTSSSQDACLSIGPRQRHRRAKLVITVSSKQDFVPRWQYAAEGVDMRAPGWELTVHGHLGADAGYLNKTRIEKSGIFSMLFTDVQFKMYQRQSGQSWEICEWSKARDPEKVCHGFQLARNGPAKNMLCKILLFPNYKSRCFRLPPLLSQALGIHYTARLKEIYKAFWDYIGKNKLRDELEPEYINSTKLMRKVRRMSAPEIPQYMRRVLQAPLPITLIHTIVLGPERKNNTTRYELDLDVENGQVWIAPHNNSCCIPSPAQSTNPAHNEAPLSPLTDTHGEPLTAEPGGVPSGAQGAPLPLVPNDAPYTVPRTTSISAEADAVQNVLPSSLSRSIDGEAASHPVPWNQPISASSDSVQNLLPSPQSASIDRETAPNAVSRNQPIAASSDSVQNLLPSSQLASIAREAALRAVREAARRAMPQNQPVSSEGLQNVLPSSQTTSTGKNALSSSCRSSAPSTLGSPPADATSSGNQIVASSSVAGSSAAVTSKKKGASSPQRLLAPLQPKPSTKASSLGAPATSTTDVATHPSAQTATRPPSGLSSKSFSGTTNARRSLPRSATSSENNLASGQPMSTESTSSATNTRISLLNPPTSSENIVPSGQPGGVSSKSLSSTTDARRSVPSSATSSENIAPSGQPSSASPDVTVVPQTSNDVVEDLPASGTASSTATSQSATTSLSSPAGSTNDQPQKDPAAEASNDSSPGSPAASPGASMDGNRESTTMPEYDAPDIGSRLGDSGFSGSMTANTSLHISSESQSSVFESIKEELCCAICTEDLHEPKDLHCSHTFCKLCLQKWLNSQTRKTSIPCPICVTETPLGNNGINGLKTNRIAKNLVAQFRSASIGSALNSPCMIHEGMRVRMTCKTCDQFVCDKCTDLCKWLSHDVEDPPAQYHDAGKILHVLADQKRKCLDQLQESGRRHKNCKSQVKEISDVIRLYGEQLKAKIDKDVKTKLDMLEQISKDDDDAFSNFDREVVVHMTEVDGAIQKRAKVVAQTTGEELTAANQNQETNQRPQPQQPNQSQPLNQGQPIIQQNRETSPAEKEANQAMEKVLKKSFPKIPDNRMLTFIASDQHRKESPTGQIVYQSW